MVPGFPPQIRLYLRVIASTQAEEEEGRRVGMDLRRVLQPTPHEPFERQLTKPSNTRRKQKDSHRVIFSMQNSSIRRASDG
jgi:hypothetical protein